MLLRVAAAPFLLALLTAAVCQAKPEAGGSFIGISAFPLASEETFGAGLNVGWTRSWYGFSVRENFMLSPTRFATAEYLQRITRRVSFEITGDAVFRVDRFVLYGGPGLAMRADKFEKVFLQNSAFRQATSTRTLVRPVVSVGLVDGWVDLSANAFFEGTEVDFRFGLGVVTNR